MSIPASVSPISLVVDAQWRVRRLIGEFVRTKLPHFDGVPAKGRESAIESVIERHPALVLMDIHLPGITDLEATRGVKSAARDTTVIVVSSSKEQFFAPLALRAGARAHVSKDLLESHVEPLLADLCDRVFPSIGQRRTASAPSHEPARSASHPGAQASISMDTRMSSIDVVGRLTHRKQSACCLAVGVTAREYRHSYHGHCSGITRGRQLNSATRRSILHRRTGTRPDTWSSKSDDIPNPLHGGLSGTRCRTAVDPTCRDEGPCATRTVNGDRPR